MQAIRNIYSVQNNQIVIDLPKSFYHKSVEVIILPINELKSDDVVFKNTNKKREGLKKLLSISFWNDEDIRWINKSKHEINQWEIEKF